MFVIPLSMYIIIGLECMTSHVRNKRWNNNHSSLFNESNEKKALYIHIKLFFTSLSEQLKTIDAQRNQKSVNLLSPCIHQHNCVISLGIKFILCKKKTSCFMLILSAIQLVTSLNIYTIIHAIFSLCRGYSCKRWFHFQSWIVATILTFSYKGMNRWYLVIKTYHKTFHAVRLLNITVV